MSTGPCSGTMVSRSPGHAGSSTRKNWPWRWNGWATPPEAFERRSFTVNPFGSERIGSIACASPFTRHSADSIALPGPRLQDRSGDRPVVGEHVDLAIHEPSAGALRLQADLDDV